MKKITIVLVLTLSICGKSFGQDQKEDIFTFPDRRFATRYALVLGNKNWVQLDLKDPEDLKRLPDVDSLLRVFNQDLLPLRDSLSDELTIKRIDYRIDVMGHKEIRLEQFNPTGPSFVIRNGSLAALKLEQDTVHILGAFYRVTVIVNRLSELPGLLDGTIDGKINELKAAKDNAWDWNKGPGVHLKADSLIRADRLPGKFGNRNQPEDKLELSPKVSIQNYKTHFVPSFDLGVDITLNNAYWKRHNSKYKYDISAYWEPQFFFQDGRTYRNDFIGIGFGIAKKDAGPGERSPDIFNISLAYMIGNRGSFYAPNTFRLGLNEIYLFNRKNNYSGPRLQPIVYFNQFFKGVTPGLRITQSF